MKVRFFFIALSLTFSSVLLAQLPDGSIAPDFTITDLDGSEHNLYPYLEAGKSVILDFSATWCGICWNYHNSHAIEDTYNIYGPDGMDMIIAFFIEADSNTNDACVRGETSDCSSSTFGDWRQGTSYPVINLTGDELMVKTDYDVTGFPTIIAIAPNKKMYETGRINADQWSSWLTETLALDATAEVSNDMIDLMITGGFGDITFEWSTGATTEDVFGLDPGVYSVTVTEERGHSVELTGIEILPEQVTIICPPDASVFCSLGSIPPANTAAQFIDAGGQISGSFDESSFEFVSETTEGSCPQVVTRTYQIANDIGLYSNCSHQILVDDETTPEFSLPTDLTVQELPAIYSNLDQLIADGGEAFDSCGMDASIFLIAETVFDNSPCMNISRIYQVSDLCGNTANAEQNFIVGLSDVAEVGFSFTNTELDYMFSATSNFSENFIWTFPNGEFSSQTNPSFTFENAGIYQVCVTADSPCGSLMYCENIVAMVDGGEVTFTCPADVNTSCSIADVPPYVSVDDWVTAGGVLTGNFEANSFEFIAEITNQEFCPEEITRVYSVFDVDGQEFTCEQTILVNDEEAPMFPSLPTIDIDTLFEMVYETYEELLSTVGAVTDNCGVDTSSFLFVSQVNDGQVPCSTIMRSYRISDLCGNTSSATQILNLGFSDASAIKFTSILQELQASFTLESSFGNTFLWTFGDGNTSTEENPQHVYSQEGTYEVCVTVTVECGEATQCEDVVLVFNSIEDYTVFDHLVTVWPNPTGNLLTLEVDPSLHIDAINMFSIDGKILNQSFSLDKLQQVDVSQLDSGMYILKIQSDDKLVIKKLLIE